MNILHLMSLQNSVQPAVCKFMINDYQLVVSMTDIKGRSK